MQCPACNGTLSPHQWHGIELDVCNQCAGIWFDFTEMYEVANQDDFKDIDDAFAGKYKDLNILELAEAMQDAPRKCPRDAITLTRHEWGNEKRKLVLDFCSKCEGTWVDAGELEGYVTILKEMQGGSLADMSDAEVQAMQAEAKQEVEEFVHDVTVVRPALEDQAREYQIEKRKEDTLNPKSFAYFVRTLGKIVSGQSH